MSQVQVPKLSSYIALGPEAASIAITKMSTYVLLVPGDDVGEPPVRHVHVYAQKIRRD